MNSTAPAAGLESRDMYMPGGHGGASEEVMDPVGMEGGRGKDG
jgi:hypothetical protein